MPYEAETRTSYSSVTAHASHSIPFRTSPMSRSSASNPIHRQSTAGSTQRGNRSTIDPSGLHPDDSRRLMDEAVQMRQFVTRSVALLLLTSRFKFDHARSRSRRGTRALQSAATRPAQEIITESGSSVADGWFPATESAKQVTLSDADVGLELHILTAPKASSSTSPTESRTHQATKTHCSKPNSSSKETGCECCVVS